MPSGGFSAKDYAPLADEVNPPFGGAASAPVSRNGTVVYSKPMSVSGSDEGYTYQSDRKGKARAIEDDGDIVNRSAYRNSASSQTWASGGSYSAAGTGSGASYPPVNGPEEEEKRIQANLAKFAAKDNARRKAARLSKVWSSPSNSRPNSIISNTSSSSSQPVSSVRPLSAISETRLGGVLGESSNRSSQGERENKEPHAQTQNCDPFNSPSPSMTSSSPFADPVPLPPATPDGYVGPGWRGGAASAKPAPRKERWWHSLCAWGADLDGGDNNQAGQAGRTNPME
ncbi:hypothetical protein CspeluHIS016_0800830 [Cutaneotrichosporon spelunceum]|uniref:Uncharacterized protein n=1 Tax=Cutaneotrichosporon spelunceum TaxID=1672016 RepID=A0AAD3TZ10_9TREE|nr:hypothetical protein CspeluHIS016_0800830 [Cutaneotrichosporon spelunceum]